MKKAIFVLDLTSGGKDDDALRYSLRTMALGLPERSTSSLPAILSNQLNSAQAAVSGTWSSSLNSKGLSISGVYQRPDGKVVFLTGKEVDAQAELLFIRLTKSTGWAVARYNNEDGTVVFAAKAPCVLSDQVKSKDPETRNEMIDRDWTKHAIVL